MARQDFRYLTWRQAPLKRAYYHATSRVVIAPLLIIGLILIGAGFYYWNRYSAIIDAGLRGDIFVRSSGIYAAPLSIRNGSGSRMSDVIAHLKKIGYQQGSPPANEKRGYYSTRNNGIDIYPGSDTKIDGEKAFPNLRVTFGRNGDGVVKLVDLDSQQQLPSAQIEPELISSVVNQEREKRKIIEYKDLPKTLVDAITAIEDRQFFEHSGINLRGIIRALLTDIQAGELKEGGSSITQQLVKNFFLKPDPTFKRKLSEAYMSMILEQRLSKEEIMAMYCNQIYLGQRGGFSINGFGEAARSYFGKDVSQLSLQESALLAGIIQSPNRLSPFTHADKAIERRNKVLDDMVDSDRITRDQAIAAKKTPLGVVAAKPGGGDGSDAPYFIDYLTRQVESQYDERDGSLRSLRIYSTVDTQLQQAASQAVSKHMAEVDKLFAKRKSGTAGLQAAIVAVNPKTGEILAMVGGRNYAQSQLNRATEARRQPGSVFKPFVYAAAIAAGVDNPTSAITAATTYIDEPKTFQGGWQPSNYGDKFTMGPVTVRDALVQSKNVITVEVAQTVGLANIARLAEKAGLSKVPQVPSLALGVAEATPLQMASAYTAFANGGRRIAPIAVKRVTTKDGTTLLESRTDTRDVMSKQVAYIMTSMMQDVLDRGTGTRVRQMGFTGVAAGKTGSSRDAWFAGYTPNLVCVVWVGFDDNSDIGLTGGVVAAPIWADFMIRALRIRPELGGYFEDPGGLVVCDIVPAVDAGPIDPTGPPVTQVGPVAPRREIFLAGTEPSGAQPIEGGVSNPEDGSSPSKPPDDTGRAANDGGSGMIPLPPDARKPEPRQENAPSQKWSFGARLKDFLGIGSPSKPKPTPTPTPTPKPEQGDAPQSSRRQLQGPTQAPATRMATPLKPVAFNTVRATGPMPSAVAAKPPPQVATRPRRVVERKPGERLGAVASSNIPGKASGKTSVDSRGATSPKDKPTANKDNEKKSADKVDPKNAGKKPASQAEIKTTVNQRESAGAQEPKSSTPSPTPTPSPKPSPTVAATPAAAHSVPKGEGTFTLEVCASSGLLPVRGKCKNTARQRFKLGGEPTKFCNGSH
ncbi:MAG TPA: PBP1A family penicillin-binding protein [Blastocatellia bacterium]|nr:PBP1A family penicillin-binding protein [Blastocatellia bacterium]